MAVAIMKSSKVELDKPRIIDHCWHEDIVISTPRNENKETYAEVTHLD